MLEVSGTRAIIQQGQKWQIDINALWPIKTVAMWMDQKDQNMLFQRALV